ncbi:MAG: hypothetical protein IPM82_20710 [Saprospiraceae bacterium]|nr:hypothetical protein [Saprospiraceae bacterium]
MDANGSEAALRLALALAYAYNEEADGALRIWKDIKENGSGLEAFQADFNLKVWNGEKCDAGKAPDCPDMPDAQNLVDGVKLHRPELAGEWISLQPDAKVKVAIYEKLHSLVYTFKRMVLFFVSNGCLNL